MKYLVASRSSNDENSREGRRSFVHSRLESKDGDRLTRPRASLASQETQHDPKDPLVTPVQYAHAVWLSSTDRRTTPIPTQELRIRHSVAQKSRLVPPCFRPAVAKQLSLTVGPDFVRTLEDQTAAHQSVVVASTLAEYTGRETSFHTLKSLQKALEDDPSTFRSNTLFLLASSDYNLCHTPIRETFRLIETHTSVHLRGFPTVGEMEFVAHKLGDIQALDQIARSAQFSWSFRPRTCAQSLGCSIAMPSVLKRAYSCGSKHVILRPTDWDVSRLLPCRKGARRSTRGSTASQSSQWFHQEYIEELRTIGEFRVFVVTTVDGNALRGRRGMVVETIHTLELPDKELVVTVISPHRDFPVDTLILHPRDFTELYAFALFVFEELRLRPDWQSHFESLEIGARLDIGVRIHGGYHRYFVNEVTRIYEADMFCDWLGEPGTSTCRAIAKVLSEVFMMPH